MFVIRVDIVAWVDDAQPGVVAARFLDAWGYEHTLIDKLPMFTAANLDQQSAYPQPGSLACALIERHNVAGRAISIIDIDQPWQIESTTGTTRFEVLSEHLLEA